MDCKYKIQSANLYSKKSPLWWLKDCSALGVKCRKVTTKEFGIARWKKFGRSRKRMRIMAVHFNSEFNRKIEMNWSFTRIMGMFWVILNPINRQYPSSTILPTKKDKKYTVSSVLWSTKLESWSRVWKRASDT